jgi:hypothetical protein
MSNVGIRILQSPAAYKELIAECEYEQAEVNKKIDEHLADVTKLNSRYHYFQLLKISAEAMISALTKDDHHEND